MRKLAFIGLMLVLAGCSTSADMAYNFRANAAECKSLSRAMVEANNVKDYKRLKSLNQRYYQTCTGD